MTVKPTRDDVWLIVIVAAVLAVLIGIFIAPLRRAERADAPPAATTDTADVPPRRRSPRAKRLGKLGRSFAEGTSRRAFEQGALFAVDRFEGRHDLRAELGSGVRPQLIERGGHGSGGPVRAIARQGVERVGDEDDARRQRDGLAVEPVRVAPSVDALVARPGDLEHDRVRGRRPGRM